MANMKEREEKTRVKSVDNTAKNNDRNMNIVQMMIWNFGHASFVSTQLHPPHTHHTVQTQDPRRKEGGEKKGNGISHEESRTQGGHREEPTATPCRASLTRLRLCSKVAKGER